MELAWLRSAGLLGLRELVCASVVQYDWQAGADSQGLACRVRRVRTARCTAGGPWWAPCPSAQIQTTPRNRRQVGGCAAPQAALPTATLRCTWLACLTDQFVSRLAS